jgi:hypothetical protein
VFLCSSRIHLAGKTLRPLLILGFRASAFCHPVGEFPLRHLARQVGAFGIRFFLVFLLDTMVHIVEHHDFIPEEFPMEEEAASSTPRAFNCPAPGAAVVHSARQHTPTQTSRASRAAPGGALSTARELLRSPPSSTTFDESMQEQLQRDDVGFIDERRWQAAIRNARYNQALRRYHQRFVHSRELRVGYLVLRRVLNREGLHKLSPSWEGPFKVTEVSRLGVSALPQLKECLSPTPGT